MNAVGSVVQKTVTRRANTLFPTERRRAIPGEAMPVRPLEPGDPERLGRFELLGRLGEGGQGIVYLGRGTGPGEERVAVKVLRSSVDAMMLERLARELDAVHQVQPFVTAGVIEASAEGDRHYIVNEFVDGPSLQDRVRERGPLSEHDLQRLAVGTATALTAIHGAGVVHRDFKPVNVLLGPGRRQRRRGGRPGGSGRPAAQPGARIEHSKRHAEQLPAGLGRQHAARHFAARHPEDHYASRG
jgi:serine/threonine protein kinase